jgi:hypothetical protein
MLEELSLLDRFLKSFILLSTYRMSLRINYFCLEKIPYKGL